MVCNVLVDAICKGDFGWLLHFVHLEKIFGHGLIYSKIDNRQRKGGRTMSALEELTRLLDDRPDLVDFVLRLVLDEPMPIDDLPVSN